jgi:hypothetical protein
MKNIERQVLSLLALLVKSTNTDTPAAGAIGSAGGGSGRRAHTKPG